MVFKFCPKEFLALHTNQPSVVNTTTTTEGFFVEFYMEKNSGIWVPQNLSELKKALHVKKVNAYGLPMIHLFYADNERFKHAWSIGKINGSNNMQHAFRIIVGLSWNWLVANLAGYKISKYDLGGTITSICYKVANKNKMYSSTHWHDILNINPGNKDYCRFLTIKTQIEELRDTAFTSEIELVNTLRGFFIENIAPFIMNDRALTMFTPLNVQRAYKEMYDKNAIQAYKAEHQEFYCCYVDITNDFSDFAVKHTDEELRSNCWLHYKAIQRLLSKAGTNTKSKHARKKQFNN